MTSSVVDGISCQGIVTLRPIPDGVPALPVAWAYVEEHPEGVCLVSLQGAHDKFWCVFKYNRDDLPAVVEAKGYIPCDEKLSVLVARIDEKGRVSLKCRNHDWFRVDFLAAPPLSKRQRLRPMSLVEKTTTALTTTIAPPDRWQRLPAVLMRQILSFLSLRELVMCVSHVSRRIYVEAQATLLRHVTIDWPLLPVAQEALLHWCRGATRLCLHHPPTEQPITNTSWLDHPPSVPAELLGHLLQQPGSTIATVELYRIPFQHVMWFLGRALASHSVDRILLELDQPRCIPWTARDTTMEMYTDQLCKELRGRRVPLKQLRLPGFVMDNAAYWVELLAFNQHLESIELTTCFLGAFVGLASVGGMSRLTELRLTSNDTWFVTDAEIQMLCQCAFASHLRVLELRAPCGRTAREQAQHLTDASCEAMATCMPRLEELVLVLLTSCPDDGRLGITEAGVTMLKSRLPALRRLVLRDTMPPPGSPVWEPGEPVEYVD